MEILAGLVKLTDDEHLPAPWFNRPSLGLLSNTAVSLGVLKSRGTVNAPPDIIVTPLDTGILHYTVSIIVDFKERPGVVYDVLSKIPRSFNIALAETVTVDQRTKHRVTLVLEYTAPGPTQKNKTPTSRRQLTTAMQHAAELRKLRDDIKNIKDFSSYSRWAVIGKKTTLEKQSSSVVNQGLIRCKDIREFLNRNYRERFGGQFDFDSVVVSSSADGRFIRYITPKWDTFEVTVFHKDTPGSLDQVSNAFKSLKYNILLSRLSRSVGNTNRPHTSTYVAVCEPVKRAPSDLTNYEQSIKDTITKAIGRKPPEYQLSVKSVTKGTEPERVAFPSRTPLPHIREFRAHISFSYLLKDYPSDKIKKVFLSYAAPDESTGNDRVINEILYDEIKSAGMAVYDGFSKPFQAQDNSHVHARMWIASAAFFIVRNRPMGQSSAPNAPGLSAAQLLELGFIHGQGKPWYGVCEAGHEKSFSSFMNPERSLITYRSLDTPRGRKEFRMKIKPLIRDWRLIPSSPRGR
jgi:hypothetical protein